MELFLQFKNIWITFGVILQSSFMTVILEIKLKSVLLLPPNFPKPTFTLNTSRSILKFLKKKKQLRGSTGNLQLLQGLISASASLRLR